MDLEKDTKDKRTILDLFGELTHETRQLVEQEVQLARAEISEKIGQVERGITSVGIGAAVCYAGFLMLLVAAFFGLNMVVEPWLAALIIGVVVAAVGLSIMAAGRENLKNRNLTLPRTQETLREDKQWIKAQMR